MLAFIAQSFPQAKLAPLDDAFEFAKVQAFNSYLCSTVHVAHAHKTRGTRWASEETSIADMKAQGAADHGGLLCADRARHAERPVGTGRCLQRLRCLSVCALGWLEGGQCRYRDLPKVADHFKRMAERPAVQKVLAEEKS